MIKSEKAMGVGGSSKKHERDRQRRQRQRDREIAIEEWTEINFLIERLSLDIVSHDFSEHSLLPSSCPPKNSCDFEGKDDNHFFCFIFSEHILTYSFIFRLVQGSRRDDQGT